MTKLRLPEIPEYLLNILRGESTEYSEGNEQRRYDRKRKANRPLSYHERKMLLELLERVAAEGGFDTYANWIRLGGALKQEGFFVEDWISLSWEEARDDCRHKWSSLPGDKLTMGTLVYFARKVDRDFLGGPDGYKHAEPSTSLDDETYMKSRIFESSKECVDYFDRLYFKAVLGNTVVVCRRNKELSENLNKTNFIDAHANKNVMLQLEDGSTKMVSGPRHWFAKTNESYAHVVFDPRPDYRPREDEINLWKGYAYEPVSNGKADKYLQFVREVICDNDETVYDYLLDVMAQMIQEPHRKTGVGIAVALRSCQGAGKNFFIENFGRLFGSAFVKIDSMESITGRFNSFLMDKILVFADEAIWGGDRANTDVLKSLITSDKINIEKKFKDMFVATNYSRFFIASNKSWAAPVERSNRRYLVLDVSESHVRDTRYFTAIQADLDHGGYADLLFRLQSRDLSGRDFQHSLPVTMATVENMIRGFSTVEGWLFDRLLQHKERVSFPGDNAPTESSLSITTDDVYEDYRQYAGKSGYTERRVSFGISLKKMLPSIKNTKIQSAGERKHCYVLPPLVEARREFESYIGIPIDWETLA